MIMLLDLRVYEYYRMLPQYNNIAGKRQKEEKR